MKTSPTTRAEKLFALLLRLYPRADREEYGAPMLQHFRDLRRDAQAAGAWPTLRFWIAILSDTATAAAKARFAEATQTKAAKGIPMNARTISFPRAFVAFFLPLLIGVALYIYAQPKMFVAIARVDTGAGYDPYYLQTQLEILTSDQNLESVLGELGLTDSFLKRAGGAGKGGPTATAIETLRRRLTVSQHRSTALVEVRVSSENSAEAAAIANQIPASYLQTIRKNRAAAAALTPVSSAEQTKAFANDAITVVDPATPTLRPVYPNIPLLAIAGTLLSAILAAIAAALLRLALRLKPAPASA